MTRSFAAFAAALALAAASAFLLEKETAAFGGGTGGVRRLLGGVTETVGDAVFLKADEYYHGGVDADRHDESAEDYAREGRIAEAPPAPDWIARVNALVSEHSHYHLSREEQKEMLPLLKFSLALDPRNVEAVLTTAYWLERHEDKAAGARAVLEKGAADNPESWEISFRLAKTLFKAGEYAGALARAEDALRSMDARGDAENFVRRDVHYTIGRSREALGDVPKAREAYEKALGYFGPGEGEKLRADIEGRLRAS